jgi:protease II
MSSIITPPDGADASTSHPPVARKAPKVDIYHGDRRVDDYFWMREKTNPEVTAYLEAENAYTEAMMAPTQAFQEALYQEMLGHIQQTDVNVPYRQGEYFYYSRTEEGKQYSIYCRKQGVGAGGQGAPEAPGTHRRWVRGRPPGLRVPRTAPKRSCST